MSKIEVNQISSQCGSTLTIGQSGDTVTLASGATQTGFGRTGTVDWCTTAKTAPFTGVSGKGYFVNTTCGAVTVTLPASPSAGDIISIKDYARTAATNNISFCRNGSKMDGVCANGGITTNGDSTTLIYVDGTKGWTSILDSTTKQYGASYITATGGTIVTCGDYKTHIFTSSGTFCVSCAGNPAGSDTVDYLVVAAGGGGGWDVGGGGGAGGYRESSGAASGCYSRSPLGACVAALPVTATTYPITIGAGGAGTSTPGPQAGSGTASIFSTITSTGGGGGGSINTDPNAYGANGGSGGGGARFGTTCGSSPGGTGNTPPVSPPQGQNGGPAGPSIGHGGGGGGATAVGTPGSPTPTQIGTGGDGAGTAINPASSVVPTGTPGPSPTLKYYGGGGGGGTRYPISPTGVGSGGVGGGGPGTINSGVDGTPNTGGGGGGRGSGNSPPPVFKGGDGGSGIVIIRYKFQ